MHWEHTTAGWQDGLKAQAVTATAHKLARIVYSLLKEGTTYVDAGQAYYEQHYHDRVLKNLERRARELGFQLVPTLLQGEVP